MDNLPSIPNSGSDAVPVRQPPSQPARWGRLIATLVPWAAALWGVSNLHQLTGAIGCSICGPWGCSGPTEALLAYHGAWLVALAPPAVLLGLRLPPAAARRWGLRVLTAGLSGVVLLAAWGSIEWLLRVEPAYRQFWWRRGLFVLIDESDFPLIQLSVVGVVWLLASRFKARREATESEVRD